MHRSMIVVSLILGLLTALLPHIIYLLVWIAGKAFSFSVCYGPFGWTAVVLVLLLWATLAYGHFWGRFHLEVNNVEYCSTDVPTEFDGFRIVHISDIHAGTFNDHPEALQRIVDTINQQDADLICFTGDMATFGIDEVLRNTETLRQITAREGVVSVLGNHDFFIYSLHNNRDRLAAAQTLTDIEQERLGWHVLRNTNITIRRHDASIAIAGVDNIQGKGQGFPTIQKGDLTKATEGIDSLFTILLTHDPSHWRAEVLPNSSAQITLSGHTHAAQVRLFGWSLANLMFRECDGRYDENGRMLYVNAGLGCTAPFRIGCPSEITVITLRHKAQ